MTDEPQNGLPRRVAVLERAFKELKAAASDSPIPDELRHIRPRTFAVAQGFKRAWAYGLIRQGELPAVKIGGHLRISYPVAIAWIRAELNKKDEKRATN